MRERHMTDTPEGARDERALDVQRLREFGALMFGTDWQRATARALGPHHPDGPRDSVDDRLVRRWIAGERQIPIWVRGACHRVARDRAQRIQEWLTRDGAAS